MKNDIRYVRTDDDDKTFYDHEHKRKKNASQRERFKLFAQQENV